MSLLTLHAALMRGESGPGPGPSDTDYAALLHFEDSIKDEVKGVIWTPLFPLTYNANSRFGSKSADLVTGNYITSSRAWYPAAPYDNDFTIEGWFYTLSNSAGRGIFHSEMGATTEHIGLGFTTTTATTQLELVFDGSSFLSATIQKTYGQWVHFAVVRHGTRVKAYLDGVQLIDASAEGKVLRSRSMVFGAYRVSMTLRGLMDEVRMSYGARYTAPFTPPSAPFSYTPAPDDRVPLWAWESGGLSAWTATGSKATLDSTVYEGRPGPSIRVNPGQDARIDTGQSFKGREFQFDVRLVNTSVPLTNVKMGGIASPQNHVNFRVDGRTNERTGPSNTAGWTTGNYPATSNVLFGQPTQKWITFGVVFLTPDRALVTRDGVDVGVFPYDESQFLAGTMIGVFTDGGANGGANINNLRLLEQSPPAPGEFQRYRLFITASNAVSSAQVAIGEIDLVGEVYGDLTSEGVASSGGLGSDAAGPENAFSNSLANQGAWHRIASGQDILAGMWIAYLLPRPRAIKRCVVWAQNDASSGPMRAPRDFLIQGSNDGASWTTLKTVTGQTGWAPGERREFTW